MLPHRLMSGHIPGQSGSDHSGAEFFEYGTTECQQFRERILATCWADVQRVAEQYLHNQVGSKAVIAPRGTDNIANNLGLIANDY